MIKFIEVNTHAGRSILNTSEIHAVLETKDSLALIVMKGNTSHYEIQAKDTFEDLNAKLEAKT